MASASASASATARGSGSAIKIAQAFKNTSSHLILVKIDDYI
jgi:hypothetical protein